MFRNRIKDRRKDQRRFSKTADRGNNKNSSDFRNKKIYRGGIRL